MSDRLSSAFPTIAGVSQCRDEHLAWAKGRALAVLDREGQPGRGDLREAVTQLVVDLLRHPEWQSYPAMSARTADGMQATGFGATAVRAWIEGWR